jgi:UDP-glucose 4-epimerase
MIFGSNDVARKDTRRSDAMYVPHRADAHVNALQACKAGLASEYEVVDAVERLAALTVPVERGAHRVGDPACIGDATSACTNLGCQPHADGTSRTVWQQKKRAAALRSPFRTAIA